MLVLNNTRLIIPRKTHFHHTNAVEAWPVVRWTAGWVFRKEIRWMRYGLLFQRLIIEKVCSKHVVDTALRLRAVLVGGT